LDHESAHSLYSTKKDYKSDDQKSNKKYIFIQLNSLLINSFQAKVPYMGPEKGILFYGGVSPSKIGLIAPY
jgi:hypothetical protein